MQAPLEKLCETTLRELLGLLASHSRASHSELTTALRHKLRTSLRNARLIGALHADSAPPDPRSFEFEDTLVTWPPRQRANGRGGG